MVASRKAEGVEDFCRDESPDEALLMLELRKPQGTTSQEECGADLFPLLFRECGIIRNRRPHICRRRSNVQAIMLFLVFVYVFFIVFLRLGN